MIEKKYEATADSLPEAMSFVEELLEQHDAGIKASMAITVALEEMFINIVHYAYPDSTGEIEMDIDFDGDDIIIHLKDNGIEFDPMAKEDPDITLSAEDRQIGGLGIYMVKKSMDHCEYHRENDVNHFMMRRNIFK